MQPASASPSLQRNLYWYVVARLLMAATLVLVSGLLWLRLTPGTQAEGEQLGEMFLRFFGMTGAATLAYLGLRQPLRNRPKAQAYIQFIADLVAIAIVVYHSGGPTSPFATFYLIVIIVAAALVGRRAGMLIATLAYLLHAGLMLWATFDATPADGVTVYQPTEMLFIYSLLVPLVGFFGAARLSSILAGDKVQEIERELEEKSGDLANLRVVHRDVIESIPSGICTTDLDGTVITINRAGLDILGRTEGELTGRPIHEDLFNYEQWSSVASASAGGERQRSELVIDRAGESVHIGFSISPLTDSSSSHRGYIVIFQDLTAWRRLEQEVRMKERMAAVGSLAAGLAHEIGNPLAAISGSVQMLAGRPDREPSESKLLEILLKESQRLDRTIKGFLRFARPKDRSSSRFDVAVLLRENVELLRNSPEVREHHEIELTVEPDHFSLVGDPDQISQIFWNLARNALKAMPEGGTLSIEGAQDDASYQVRFTDTGHGMTEQERANLFHPFQSFFDTGTGIGMAIVYRIVQEHGGELAVESEPDQGCTITVSLPILEELAQQIQEAAP